jgi:N-acetylglucosamine-6-phosphate deacetylase
MASVLDNPTIESNRGGPPSRTRDIVGSILTPNGFVDGHLLIGADGHIKSIDGVRISDAVARERATSKNVPIVVPGFIDLHVHGGGGADVMDGAAAARAIAATHAKHGTTSLLATTMTAPAADIEAALKGLRPFCDTSIAPTNGARILGVHLEGPYINPGKLGAQPDYARPLEMDELRRWHAITPIRLITLAPELPGNLEMIKELVAAGFAVHLGHSLASFEEGIAALKNGATGFTHLFNAMTGLHHRKPGLVGAALAEGTYAEIIPDLLHVHPGAIRAAMRAIPRIFCVTDSTSATGMPDGEYRLGRNTVMKCLGGVRLADGTLAGSTLTMDQALRNLVEALGMELLEASRRVSTYAADHLGLTDRGRLSAGAWADIVVLSADLNVREVYVEGCPQQIAQQLE